MWSALEEAFTVMDGHTREVETALAAFRHTLAPLYKAHNIVHLLPAPPAKRLLGEFPLHLPNPTTALGAITDDPLDGTPSTLNIDNVDVYTKDFIDETHTHSHFTLSIFHNLSCFHPPPGVGDIHVNTLVKRTRTSTGRRASSDTGRDSGEKDGSARRSGRRSGRSKGSRKNKTALFGSADGDGSTTNREVNKDKGNSGARNVNGNGMKSNCVDMGDNGEEEDGQGPMVAGGDADDKEEAGDALDDEEEEQDEDEEGDDEEEDDEDEDEDEDREFLIGHLQNPLKTRLHQSHQTYPLNSEDSSKSGARQRALDAMQRINHNYHLHQQVRGGRLRSVT